MKGLLNTLLLAGILVVAPIAFAQNEPTANQNPSQSPELGSRSAQNSNNSGDMSIPTGTQISIRTNETIDSSTARVNDTFPAEVSSDVLDANGRVIVPRGSNARLILRSVNSGGTTSSPQLALDLDSITVGGQNYQVSTTDIQQGAQRQGIGKNRRTAEMVGGGAALGTLLGAIAGGGKGAAIGAVAGAAAGGTAQVLTKGKQVKVPAETVLKFQLDQPLQLTPSRR